MLSPWAPVNDILKERNSHSINIKWAKMKIFENKWRPALLSLAVENAIAIFVPNKALTMTPQSKTQLYLRPVQHKSNVVVLVSDNSFPHFTKQLSTALFIVGYTRVPSTCGISLHLGMSEVSSLQQRWEGREVSSCVVMSHYTERDKQTKSVCVWGEGGN